MRSARWNALRRACRRASARYSAGQSLQEKLSGSQAPFLLMLSVLLVFLVLAALYESWTIPLSVLLTVPLGILGAVTAAMLRGLPNDVYFTVGIVTIIGLAAKDGILIIEFAKALREQAAPIKDATIEACRMRFRPIVMTGLAFVFGVAPMTIAAGASAKSQQALGTVVMGGMTAVVILALLMVPIFFVTVQAFFYRGRGAGFNPPTRAVPTSRSLAGGSAGHEKQRNPRPLRCALSPQTLRHEPSVNLIAERFMCVKEPSKTRCSRTCF